MCEWNARPGWAHQEGEGGSEHRLNDWQPCCVNALSGQGGDNKKVRVGVSDNMNDWQHCCVNALSGQGGDNKKARVRVSDNLNDCDWQPWCANGHRRRTVANIPNQFFHGLLSTFILNMRFFWWERGWE